MITPREFVDRWGQSTLREQQAAQSHFDELCELVNHKTPTQTDPNGEFFTFEEQVTKATGGKGRADVWYKGRFAWEYKGKHQDLDAAYAQLLAYKGDLGNPPLLVVCDFLEYRIYPQWPNTSGQPFVFKNEDLLNKEAQNYIRWLLEDPDKFLELRQTELERREKITLDLAFKFAHLADLMRRHKDENGNLVWQPMQIARFLTKLVFTLFAEDVGLLPRIGGKKKGQQEIDPTAPGAITYIAQIAAGSPGGFSGILQDLFLAMDGQRGYFVGQPVPYFNGGIFKNSSQEIEDGLEVLDLTQIPGGINLLQEVSEADWRYVNPTIFGTLFEGALDESKRAQLGAHYTSESDIQLVIEPVLMQPLYQEWDTVRAEAEPLMQVYLKQETPKATQEAKERLTALYNRMMNRLGNTTVLDPACGSGNFLYMSLRAMKDLEERVRKFFEALGLPYQDVVTPRQFYGIEKDEFAAKLAHVVVWIGYLQWRYLDEGVLHPVLPKYDAHARSLPIPILKDKLSPDEPDRIICADSILRYDITGKPYEPGWPEVDIIVGNPPFLGAKWMQSELGEKYKTDLWQLYDGKINGTSDLVTYWFEKARAQVANQKAKRVGLLATNTIRQGGSAEVLRRIKDTGDIFFAYVDHPWTLKGASLRVALIGFDDGTEKERTLNGGKVTDIAADLSIKVDLSSAQVLSENEGLCFRGHERGGPFVVSAALAKKFLTKSENRAVIHPWYSGQDLTSHARDEWVIDFGNRGLGEAQSFREIFDYLEGEWAKETETIRREKWWIHRRPATDLREAVQSLERFIVTPLVSKHRVFIWLGQHVRPDTRLVAFARADNYFFGVLHSWIHEIWALRQSGSHGIGNDPVYNKNTTFETFPFPRSPGKEDTNSEVYKAISDAAKQLDDERGDWLHPDEGMIQGPAAEKILAERTLTNLYNALEAYRERKAGGKSNAAAFAPRLAELHDALDRAVLAAYGWDDLADRLRTLDGDEELLRRLLALNLERAKS